MLLSQHATEGPAQRSLNALTEDIASYHGAASVPTMDARRIYTIRSKGSESNEGFETLLPALNTFSEASVKIHAIQTDEENLIVFTDPTVAKLLGILIIKRRLIPAPVQYKRGMGGCDL